MALLHTCSVLFGVCFIAVWQQWFAEAVSRMQIVVPPDANFVHIDLKGEEYIIPLHGRFPPKRRPKFHSPLTPREVKKFYTQMAKLQGKIPLSPKWPSYPWTSLEFKPYRPLKEDEIPSEHVKPVVEHIEDDLKYDFRTKTHSF